MAIKKMKPIKAKYWERVFAWIIDFIIVSIAFGFIIGDFNLYFISGLNNYLLASIIFFIYWFVLEHLTGRSFGKMVLFIKTIPKKGDNLELTQSALQSFGKAFILPIDIIIGLVYRPEEKTRILNIISETEVIKIEKL